VPLPLAALPPQAGAPPAERPPERPPEPWPTEAPPPPPPLPLAIEPLAEMERKLILAALDHTQQDVPRAAALLQVNPSTIYRKLAAWRAS